MLPPRRSTRSDRSSPEDSGVVLEDETSRHDMEGPILPTPSSGPEDRNVELITPPDAPPEAKPDQVILSAPSTKKGRRQLTVSQRLALEELASRGSHPSIEARRALAEQLGLELKIISVWFQNKRRPTNKLHEATPADAYERRGIPAIDVPPRKILADVNSNNVSDGLLCKALVHVPVVSTASSPTFHGDIVFATSPDPDPGFPVIQSDCSLVEGTFIPISRQRKHRSLEWACHNDKRAIKRTRTSVDVKAQESSIDRVPGHTKISRGRQRTDRKPRKPSPRIRRSRDIDLRTKATTSSELQSGNGRYVDEDILDVAQALLQLGRPLAARHSI